MSTLPIRLCSVFVGSEKVRFWRVGVFLAFPSLFFLKFNSNVDAEDLFWFELCRRCTRRWSMFGTVLVPKSVNDF